MREKHIDPLLEKIMEYDRMMKRLAGERAMGIQVKRAAKGEGSSKEAAGALQTQVEVGTSNMTTC